MVVYLYLILLLLDRIVFVEILLFLLKEEGKRSPFTRKVLQKTKTTIRNLVARIQNRIHLLIPTPRIVALEILLQTKKKMI